MKMKKSELRKMIQEEMRNLRRGSLRRRGIRKPLTEDIFEVENLDIRDLNIGDKVIDKEGNEIGIRQGSISITGGFARIEGPKSVAVVKGKLGGRQDIMILSKDDLDEIMKLF